MHPHVILSLLVALCSPIVNAVEVYDYLQRKITLEKPAQRIIALAPHIVENLYSAGAGDRVVGVVDYSDYPEAAKNIPRVGRISSYSIEAIVALKPDLVVVWRSGHGGKVMDKLLALGLKVYANDPRVLEDVSRSIRDYGKLAGTEAIAETNAKQFEARLKTLRDAYSNASPISTLYQVWNDPIQTINDTSIISDVIRLCGGANVFGDSAAVVPKISVESVILKNPQAIVASGMGEERPEWLDMWRTWRNIEAVKRDNLFYVPPDIIQRHTVRLLDGAEHLCLHLATARKKMTQ